MNTDDLAALVAIVFFAGGFIGSCISSNSIENKLMEKELACYTPEGEFVYDEDCPNLGSKNDNT